MYVCFALAGRSVPLALPEALPPVASPVALPVELPGAPVEFPVELPAAAFLPESPKSMDQERLWLAGSFVASRLTETFRGASPPGVDVVDLPPVALPVALPVELPLAEVLLPEETVVVPLDVA